VSVFVPIKLEEWLQARHARLEDTACAWARSPTTAAVAARSRRPDCRTSGLDPAANRSRRPSEVLGQGGGVVVDLGLRDRRAARFRTTSGPGTFQVSSSPWIASKIVRDRGRANHRNGSARPNDLGAGGLRLLLRSAVCFLGPDHLR
jgi:hypothetical protein